MEQISEEGAAISQPSESYLDETDREIASWTVYAAPVLSELKARHAPVSRAELRLRLAGTETPEGESEFIFALWFLDTAGAIRRCDQFEEADTKLLRYVACCEYVEPARRQVAAWPNLLAFLHQIVASRTDTSATRPEFRAAVRKYH